jgi:hypothetical protein
MVKWLDIENWKVKIELLQTEDSDWTWTFQAVDGPHESSIAPVQTMTLAFQQAFGAASRALGNKGGPDSARTDFGDSI